MSCSGSTSSCGRARFLRWIGRAGAWVLPWLGSLALISYLGSYGDSAAKAFGLGVGALLMFAVSVAVYLAAYHLRLPRARVAQFVDGSN